jgi:outer membrane phospholipase A
MRYFIALIALLIGLVPHSVQAQEALTFQPYKPAYIAYNNSGDDMSIKYRYSTRVPVVKEALNVPFLPDGLPVLAYTQESVIDPDSSFTFIRNNFQPELFYEIETDWRWLGTVRVGYEHLSSGEDAEGSNGVDFMFAEARVPLYVTSDISLEAYIRPRYIIQTEQNTDGIRDLMSVWGQDFYPTGALKLQTEGSTYWVEFDRDSFDAEVMMELVSKFNMHVFGQYHSGTVEDIARWAMDTQGGGAGVAFAW